MGRQGNIGMTRLKEVAHHGQAHSGAAAPAPGDEERVEDPGGIAIRDTPAIVTDGDPAFRIIGDGFQRHPVGATLDRIARKVAEDDMKPLAGKGNAGLIARRPQGQARPILAQRGHRSGKGGRPQMAQRDHARQRTAQHQPGA